MKKKDLAPSQHCSLTGKWGQLKHMKLHLNTENHLYCVGGQTLVQVAQCGCGIFILGGTQNPAVHSPAQPALADPV